MPVDDLLSPREIEIARAYADGATYQGIADRLGIAPSTVRTHLATIYRKLEVSSKLALHARLAGQGAGPAEAADHAAVISELALSLEEAIARERALSEVLRIIGGARGRMEAVMPAILGHALELCDAEFGILFECRPADRFRAGFARGIPAAFQRWLDAQGTFEVGAETGLGRMQAARETVNIIDVRAERAFRAGDPLRHATAVLGGARSFVAIPMLAGDELVRAFTIYRQQVRPFGEGAARVARMFAEQSVVAMENARLMTALRAAADGPDARAGQARLRRDGAT